LRKKDIISEIFSLAYIESLYSIPRTASIIAYGMLLVCIIYKQNRQIIYPNIFCTIIIHCFVDNNEKTGLCAFRRLFILHWLLLHYLLKINKNRPQFTKNSKNI